MMARTGILSVSRYNDWWGCKMAPLLAVGYGTAIAAQVPLYRAAGWIFLVIGALVVGGVYASTLNDLTDLGEDIRAGKTNRLSRIAPRYRWCFPVCALAAGVVLAFYLLARSPLTAVLYAMPCLCFTLYSVKPFRLKSRGLWGVLADACGAHLFPGLCLVAGTSTLSGAPVPWIWFMLVGVWSLCFGLRGILWHQFQDRARDLAVGLHTFATRHDPRRFRNTPRYIIILEVAAFTLMMWLVAAGWAVPLMACYGLVIYLRSRFLGLKTGLVLTEGGSARQIFLLDYYVLLFPLSLLLSAISQPFVWAFLLFHLIAFPLTPLQLLKDLYHVSRRLLPSAL